MQNNQIEKQSCIYKICCKDLTITDIYVGSTYNLEKRTRQHKSVCNNKNSSKYNIHVYDFIRKNGSFENWQIVLIKYFPCVDRLELEQEERKITEELKATLNKNCARLTEEEKKDYHKLHNEKFIKEHPTYYKDLYDNNKEEIKEKQKINYEKNKLHLNEKVECECGILYTRACKTNHQKSKRHNKLLLEKINIVKEDEGIVKKLIKVYDN